MMMDGDETMPGLLEHGILDVDFDLEQPQPRDRCNTWPLQRPAGDLGHHTSPLIHEGIPEETNGSLEESSESPSIVDTSPYQNFQPVANDVQSHCQQGVTGLASSHAKKNSSRRNAWGNLSYADLITQAILNSPEKRLTLSQIYDWMVQNVPYFRDKGDSNSSAGWKNSIRHNLSLHSRFIRIQNEGAGKSSWWVLNPDAKSGKASRRRTSTMPSGGEDPLKSSIEKKRRGAKKRLEQRAAALLNGGQQNGSVDFGVDNEICEIRADGYNHDLMSESALDFGEFRNRSGSNLSTYSSIAGCGTGAGSRCLSPTYEDLEFADWDTGAVPVASDAGPSLDLANSVNASLTLMSEASPTPPSCLWQSQQQLMTSVRNSGTNSPVHVNGNGDIVSENLNHRQHVTYSPKLEPRSCQISSVPYHSPAKTIVHQRATSTTSLVKSEQHGFCAESNRNHFFPHYTQLDSPNVPNGLSTSSLTKYAPQCNGALPPQTLPAELSDIQYDNRFKNDVQCDIDQVIRHELRVAGRLDFNIGEYFANI